MASSICWVWHCCGAGASRGTTTSIRRPVRRPRSSSARLADCRAAVPPHRGASRAASGRPARSSRIDRGAAAIGLDRVGGSGPRRGRAARCGTGRHRGSPRAATGRQREERVTTPPVPSAGGRSFHRCPAAPRSCCVRCCHLHRRASGRRGDRAVGVGPAGRRATATRHPRPAPDAGLLPADGAGAALVRGWHPAGPAGRGQPHRLLVGLLVSTRGHRRPGRGSTGVAWRCWPLALPTMHM